MAARRILATCLIVVGIIHLLPLTGVAGPGRLQALYGVAITDPDLVVLMRHRAVLFGILGAYCVLAAFAQAVVDRFQANRMALRAVVDAVVHARVAMFGAVVSHRSSFDSTGENRRARITAPVRLLAVLREGRVGAVVTDELHRIGLRAAVGHFHARRSGRHAGKGQALGVGLFRQ